jgi:hypothetical protein
VGLRAGLDVGEHRKILLLPGFEIPALQPLARLYTDEATSTPDLNVERRIVIIFWGIEDGYKHVLV